MTMRMMGLKYFSTNFRVACDTYASVVQEDASMEARCVEILPVVGLFQVSKSSYKNVNLVHHIVLLIVAKDMDFGISQWDRKP